jgi:hypothetical protein
MFGQLLITGLVALACGTAGAWGYMHFFATESGASTSKSTKEAGSNEQSTSKTASDAGDGSSSHQSTTSSSAASGASSSPEAGELKEDILNLSRRIDRLTQDIERLQQLMSLAVPLLQRITPKS